jgi:hypothetical protein
MSDAEIKFANLQSRYTELLEKRIAQLEAAITAPIVLPVATAAAVNGNDEKKDDDDSSDDEKTKEDVCFTLLRFRPQSDFHPLTFSAENG